MGKGNGCGKSGFAVNRGAVYRGFTVLISKIEPSLQSPICESFSKDIFTLRPKIIAVADLVGHNGVLDYLKITTIIVTFRGFLGLLRH